MAAPLANQTDERPGLDSSTTSQRMTIAAPSRPNANPDPDAAAYVSEMVKATTVARGLIGDASALVQRPELTSQSWQSDIGFLRGFIQVLHNETVRIDPPPAYIAVHAEFLAGIELADAAMADFGVAIGTVDMNRVQSGRIKLAEGDRRVQAANVLLRELAR